jgi:hypothetical protein
MLQLRGESFTSGRAKFRDQAPRAPELTAKIFVKIEFPNLEGSVLAQIDSGSAYSMLDLELARALGVLDGDGDRGPGRPSLGYTGFLDKLRIGLDPPVNDFYFGETG